MDDKPKPGVYYDVPFDDYLAWNAVSNSRLSLFAKSARAYKFGHAIEPKPYLQLGRLLHCGVLEESAFADRYAVCPDYHLDGSNRTADGDESRSRGTKYVRQQVEAFTAANSGKEIVGREWYSATLAVVREIAANREAHQCFNSGGVPEVSIVWEERGVLCKARLDYVGGGRLVDLKSTTAIDRFANAIANYGYHRQLAHYAAGWRQLSGQDLEPWLVAVESTSPHTVQAAPLGEDALAAGRQERFDLLSELKRCTVGDSWPAKDNPRQWNLPAWYGEREEIELVINGKRLEV